MTNEQTIKIDEEAMIPLLELVAGYCAEHSLNVGSVLATFATLAMRSNDLSLIVIENGAEDQEAYEVKLHMYKKGDKDVVHA